MTTESIYVVDGRQDSIVAPRLEREVRLLREERGPVIRALFPYGGEGWLAVGYEAAKELIARSCDRRLTSISAKRVSVNTINAEKPARANLLAQ